jgi:hypothetical protein
MDGEILLGEVAERVIGLGRALEDIGQICDSEPIDFIPSNYRQLQ